MDEYKIKIVADDRERSDPLKSPSRKIGAFYFPPKSFEPLAIADREEV